MIDTLTRPVLTDTTRPALDEETIWRAVVEKDVRYEGQFVVAVRTTGIYCRPGCPAKCPRRENVEFFATTAAAREAGYRACLRCKPDSALPFVEVAERACRYLDANLDRTVSLRELGEVVGVSPHHLQRTFKRVVGISPREYVAAKRLEELKAGLQRGEDVTVTAAMYDAGYGSSSRLYERAPAQLGMTPGAYRRGGAGMTIGYATATSPLGRLLVAATERGVSAVYLGADDAELAAALHAEYPNATIAHDDRDLHGWLRDTVRYLEGHEPHLDLPLDVRATAFQWRVWQELRRIPRGATRSYREVAEAIGQPSAVRAVARACASNPVALTVPCHRVVRTGGELGGYRWGVERKQRLLEQGL